MSTSNKIEVRNPIPFGLGNVEVRSIQNSFDLAHLDKKRKHIEDRRCQQTKTQEFEYPGT